MDKFVACERPLTVYLNWRPIVTLDPRAKPESLALGYLKNQGFISDVRPAGLCYRRLGCEFCGCGYREQTADPLTRNSENRDVRLWSRHGLWRFMQDLNNINLPTPSLKQSTLYSRLKNINEWRETYKECWRCAWLWFWYEDDKIMAFLLKMSAAICRRYLGWGYVVADAGSWR